MRDISTIDLQYTSFDPVNTESYTRPMSTHAKKIVHFLYEAGQLAKTPRSYYAFLGHGQQSVAEHINRVAYISYALGQRRD